MIAFIFLYEPAGTEAAIQRAHPEVTEVRRHPWLPPDRAFLVAEEALDDVLHVEPMTFLPEPPAATPPFIGVPTVRELFDEMRVENRLRHTSNLPTITGA